MERLLGIAGQGYPHKTARSQKGSRLPRISEVLNVLLKTRDERIDLVQVVYALGWLGDNDSVPLLISSIEDPDVYLRTQCVVALGRLGDRRAIDPLCEAVLTDPSTNVRANAPDALGQFKGERVQDSLRMALKDKSAFCA